MAAVAERAGVAAGTIYVHYGSKDELILVTHREVKEELGRAAATAMDPGDPPSERFRALWRSVYRHLAGDPDRARFLVQIESSPYSAGLHAERAATPKMSCGAPHPPQIWRPCWLTSPWRWSTTSESGRPCALRRSPVNA